MAIFRLTTTSRGIMAAALIADLDDQASPWYGEIYSGTMPVLITDPISGPVKLGTVTGGADPSATQSNGVITFNTISSDLAADNTGTATFMRIYKGNGSVWADLDLGEAGSGATGIMNSASVVAGGPINLNSFTIQVGV